MKEFVEKLIGRLEEESKKWLDLWEDTRKRKGIYDYYADGMNDAFDEAINIVNQLAEEYKEQNNQDLMIVESLPSIFPMQPFEVEALDRVIECAKYSGGLIEKLLEAKKNCGEDSDCSECPFGQIEDRCILNELQIESDNNGWIPCSERLPEDCTIYEVTAQFRNGMCYIEFAYYDESRGEWWKHDDDGLVNVLAWKPLPDPYIPKQEEQKG